MDELSVRRGSYDGAIDLDRLDALLILQEIQDVSPEPAPSAAWHSTDERPSAQR